MDLLRLLILRVLRSLKRFGGGGRVWLGSRAGNRVGGVGGSSPLLGDPRHPTQGHPMWSCEKPAALNEF